MQVTGEVSAADTDVGLGKGDIRMEMGPCSQRTAPPSSLGCSGSAHRPRGQAALEGGRVEGTSVFRRLQTECPGPAGQADARWDGWPWACRWNCRERPLSGGPKGETLLFWFLYFRLFHAFFTGVLQSGLCRSRPLTSAPASSLRPRARPGGGPSCALTAPQGH